MNEYNDRHPDRSVGALHLRSVDVEVEAVLTLVPLEVEEQLLAHRPALVSHWAVRQSPPAREAGPGDTNIFCLEIMDGYK